MKIHKVLYGLLRSALLFYCRLVSELEDYSFKLNPYDLYVANENVNGTQITLIWHVNYLMVTPRATSR